MRTPFTFSLSLLEWCAANGLDASLPAVRQLWSDEGQTLYQRIKGRPSKTEDELLTTDIELPEERRRHSTPYGGARA